MSDAAESLKAFVLGIVRPLLLGRTSYEYIVKAVAESDGRMDLVPAHSRVAPKLKGVPQWPGIAGGRSRPVLNTSVEVRFLDGDPAKPIVGAYVPLTSELGRPLRVELDASERLTLAHGTLPVGRGGATFQLVGGGGVGALVITDPDGVTHTWNIAATGFTVTGGAGTVLNRATIDAGRPEILV